MAVHLLKALPLLAPLLAAALAAARLAPPPAAAATLAACAAHQIADAAVTTWLHMTAARGGAAHGLRFGCGAAHVFAGALLYTPLFQVSRVLLLPAALPTEPRGTRSG